MAPASPRHSLPGLGLWAVPRAWNVCDNQPIWPTQKGMATFTISFMHSTIYLVVLKAYYPTQTTNSIYRITNFHRYFPIFIFMIKPMFIYIDVYKTISVLCVFVVCFRPGDSSLPGHIQHCSLHPWLGTWVSNAPRSWGHIMVSTHLLHPTCQPLTQQHKSFSCLNIRYTLCYSTTYPICLSIFVYFDNLVVKLLYQRQILKVLITLN